MAFATQCTPQGYSSLSAGIITTVIVLIIGYVIVSRIVGLAVRLVAPLVLLVILGGAGLFSGLIPDRSPATLYAPYEQAQHRPDADLSDMRLRDIADLALDAVRSVLQSGLALLNGLSEPEPGREPGWSDRPQHSRRGERYGAPPDGIDDPHQGERRREW